MSTLACSDGTQDSWEFKNYEELLEQANRSGGEVNILLGNGYSIAASDRFCYASLSDTLCNNIDNGFYGNNYTWAKNILKKYGSNFEYILKMLKHASTISKIFNSHYSTNLFYRAHQSLSNLFLDTLNKIHPDQNELRTISNSKTRIQKNGDFIKKFTKIYTLNYDLLLYWSILNNELTSQFKDNFLFTEDGTHKFNFDNPNIANFFYIHGALHLRKINTISAYKKLYQNETKANLLYQLRKDMRHNQYPLVVFEGKKEEKLQQIRSNDYLSFAYESLKRLNGVLFTYGWSCAKNDGHILDAILTSNKLNVLNIGLFGYGLTGTLKHNEVACKLRSEVFLANRNRINKLELYFYDTSKLSIW